MTRVGAKKRRRTAVKTGGVKRPPSLGRKKRGHGQQCSSESNPVTTKHRSLAGSIFPLIVPHKPDQDPPETAAGDVATHLEKLGLEQRSCSDEAKSRADSFCSQFTSCTNPTFEKVHRIWRSGSDMHKEVLAVLAAVTELIKEKKGEESDVEYFGALLTTMDSVDEKNEGRIAATAYLLSLVVDKMSKGLLLSQFESASEIIFRRLSSSMSGEAYSATKQLTICLGKVLCAQPAVSFQKDASQTHRRMVDCILALTGHEVASIRKVARIQIVHLLEQHKQHPCFEQVARFAVDTIEKATDEDVTKRIVTLLSCILHVMPAKQLKMLVETLFRLMANSTNNLKMAALDAIMSAFLRLPDKNSLPKELNQQIILALLDFEPVQHEYEAFVGWMRVLTQTELCILANDDWSKIDAESELLLWKVWEKLISVFELGAGKILVLPASQCLKELCDGVSKCGQIEAVVDKLLIRLDQALNLRSVEFWPLILDVFAYFFLRFKAALAINCDAFKKVIRNLAQLRESEESGEHSTHIPLIEKTIGSAVANIGPEAIFEALPFTIDLEAPIIPLEIPRSWLLPLATKHLQSNVKLAHFHLNFLPMAAQLEDKLAAWQSSDLAQFKSHISVYKVLRSQLWELFVRYCKWADDGEVAVPKIAEILGMLLLKKPHIRQTVLSGLRALLKKEENSEVLDKYTKNFMPILFDIYTSPEEKEESAKLSTLETMRSFVEHSKRDDLFADYAKVAMEKFLSSETDAAGRLLLDILITVAPRISKNNEIVQEIFEKLSQNLEYQQRAKRSQSVLEKKLFRFLQSAVVGVSEHFLEFEGCKILNFTTDRLTTVDLNFSSAAASMLAVVTIFVDRNPERIAGIFDKLFYKVVELLSPTCSKRTRTSAARFLITSVRKRLRVSAEETTKILDDVFDMCWQYSVREPANSVCCLLAVNVLFRAFHKDMLGLTNLKLVEQTTSLCRRDSASQKYAFELLTILVKLLPDYQLRQCQENLLESLLKREPNLASARARSVFANLLKHLSKTFGHEVLAKYTGEENDALRKMLRNVGKRQRRKQRENEQLLAGNGVANADYDAQTSASSAPDTIAQLLADSDADEDSDFEGKAAVSRVSKGGRKNGTGTVLIKNEGDGDQTGGNGEVLDLLQRDKLAKALVQSDKRRRKRKRNKDENRGFKTDKSGRLIITEESDEEEKGTVGNTSSLGKKRRFQTAKEQTGADVTVDNDENEFERPLYKPGGSGIHRSICDVKEEKTERKSGKKKKRRGDAKKKGQKLEPYTYLKLGGKKERSKFRQGLKAVVGKKRRGKKNK